MPVEYIGVIVHEIGNLIAMNSSKNIKLRNYNPSKKYSELDSYLEHHKILIKTIKNNDNNEESKLS